MSAGHTPGPWHVEPVTNEDGEQFWSEDFAGKVFCVCHPGTECNATTVVDWINEGDARLIAAAPEMLKAVQRVLDRGYVSSSIDEERDDHTMLVAAIAKATGQEGGAL